MSNTDIDQFGIPRPGFIKADKDREQENRALTQNKAGILNGKNTIESLSLIDSVSSHKAAMLSAMILILMIGIIMYLVGENRTLSKVANYSARNLDTQAAMIKEIAALQNQIEVERIKASQGVASSNQDIAQSTTQMPISNLQQAPGAAVAQQSLVQVVDDHSRALSNPNPGKGFIQLAPEIEAMLVRSMKQVNAQSQGNRAN